MIDIIITPQQIVFHISWQIDKLLPPRHVKFFVSLANNFKFLHLQFAIETVAMLTCRPLLNEAKFDDGVIFEIDVVTFVVIDLIINLN